MKFGRNLEEGIDAKWESWRTYAVSYNEMKKLLPEKDDENESNETEAELCQAWKNDDSNQSLSIKFWNHYNESIISMRTFYEEKLESATAKLTDLKNQLEKLRLSLLPGPRRLSLSSSPSNVDELKQTLLEFQSDIDLILEFIAINHTAFRKILKKYDKRTMSSVKELKMSQLLQSHDFLFGGGLIADAKLKTEAMIQKLHQIDFDSHSQKSTSVMSNQCQPVHNRLSQETLRKAQAILDEMDKSPIFSSNKVRSNAVFERREIEIGKYLGEGEFGIVHEIHAFHVKETCPICFLHQEKNKESDTSGESAIEATVHSHNRTMMEPMTNNLTTDDGFSLRSINKKLSTVDFEEFEDDHQEEAEELVCNRGFMKEHCERKGSARYAIKEVKTTLEGAALADGALDICIEAKFLSVISHPNIIKLCGTSRIGGGSPKMFIVLDRLYDTLGTRITTWKKNVKSLTKGLFGGMKNKNELQWLWNERLLAMYDIARAMRYLHNNDIMYRDLKPENAGFDVRGNMKLFDFGLAKELQDKDNCGEDKYNISGRTGTRRYMSPEVALCKPYGKPADVYSFTILFWETLALEQPYKGYGYEKHAKDVVQKGKRPQIPNDWPTFIKTLASESWSADPSLRPNFNRLCSIIKGELSVKDINLSDRTNHLLDVSHTNRKDSHSLQKKSK